MQSNPNEEFEKIALDTTLEFIQSNDWEDSDGFGLAVAREYCLLRRECATVHGEVLEKRVAKATGFFRFNPIRKAVFYNRLCKRLNKNKLIQIPPIYRDEIINVFENELRRFVEKRLREKHGVSWQHKIPPELLANVKNVKKKQSKRGEPPSKLLAYATVGELYGIIQANWIVFKPYFLDLPWLEQRLIHDYAIVRNPNAHNRHLIKNYEAKRDTLIEEVRERMGD